MNKQATKWEEIFARYTSDEELIRYKEVCMAVRKTSFI